VKRKSAALQMQQFVGEEKNDLLDYLRSLQPEQVFSFVKNLDLYFHLQPHFFICCLITMHFSMVQFYLALVCYPVVLFISRLTTCICCYILYLCMVCGMAIEMKISDFIKNDFGVSVLINHWSFFFFF